MMKQTQRESFNINIFLDYYTRISEISQKVFRTIEENTDRRLSTINIYNTGNMLSKSTFNFLVNDNQPQFSLLPIK